VAVMWLHFQNNSMFKSYFTIYLCLFFASPCFAVTDTTKTSKYNWAQEAENSQAALNKQFWSDTRHYYVQSNAGENNFNYWWEAHALDVLVDGYNRTHSNTYIARMDELLNGVLKKNHNTMRIGYYDDMEWMSLACLRAYDATANKQYKTVALQLWNWIKLGWSDVKGGGIAWATDHLNSKNACANAPAAIIAARMYQLDKNPEDLEWAKKIYNWQKKYVVDPATSLVYDGYGNTHKGNMFTYNQGTYIGATLELYRITKDTSYINEAIRNADYVVGDRSKFSPHGILRGENSGDGGLFKGIFIRYLSQLIIKGDLDKRRVATYTKYLQNNGKSLTDNATKKPEYIFGQNWRDMPVSLVSDCSVQLSGIMLFETLDELSRLNKLK
jgi:predicted alpha-1,6-mannanase (GH76 family)